MHRGALALKSQKLARGGGVDQPLSGIAPQSRKAVLVLTLRGLLIVDTSLAEKTTGVGHQYSSFGVVPVFAVAVLAETLTMVEKVAWDQGSGCLGGALPATNLHSGSGLGTGTVNTASISYTGSILVLAGSTS